MSQAIQDLWGELVEEEAATSSNPITSLLNEQADLLSQKTKGRVEAKVEVLAAGGVFLLIRFILVARRLRDYKYELFRVAQRTLDFPVTVISGETETECEDEDQYREEVGRLLRDGRRVVTRLMVAERDAVDW